MLTLIGSVLTAVTSNTYPAKERCGTNVLVNKLIVSTYTSLVDSPANIADAVLTSFDGLFTTVQNPQYHYALAYARTSKQIGPNVKWVYVKLDTKKLLGVYTKSTLTKPTKLGNAYTIMGKSKAGEAKINLDNSIVQLPPSSTDVGLYLKLSADDFDKLDFLYVARLAPIEKMETSLVDVTDNLKIDYSCEIVSTSGETDLVVQKDLVKKDVLPQANGFKYDNVVLESINALFQCSKNASQQGNISNEMLARVCFVNEDVKLTSAIYDVVCYEREKACCLSEGLFECNFEAFCNTAVTTICNTTTNGAVCEQRAAEVCKTSVAPRQTYNVCSTVGFYNCNFNNCQFAIQILNGLFVSYGKNMCYPLSIEDFCDLYNVSANDLMNYCPELFSEVDAEKKPTKPSSRKPSSSSTDAKKDGFFKRNKKAIVITVVSVVGVGCACTAGYMLL